VSGEPCSETSETISALRRRLADAEALLEAIREGQVDALVVGAAENEHVYSLESPELPYRQFLEQMGEGAVSLDAEARILFCNRFFASLVQQPREAILGHPFEAFLVPRCRDGFRAALAKGGLEHLGVALRSKEGPELPVQVTVTAAGEDSAQRFTVVVTDLSERERLRELSALREASEAANQAKDQFLAYVGHDLRTPLQVIKGWTQYLLKRTDDLGESARKALLAIDRNADLQRKLIDDLLDVSRIVSGKLHLERAVLDLGALAQACVAGMLVAAEAKGVHLSCAVALPVFVDGDPQRLDQVLNNLIGNAIKFTPRGGRVEVTVLQAAEAARIVIEDDGQGIDPAILSQVFDRFRQGRGDDHRRERGLGLGLAISKHIVELHGGVVRATSQGLGQGATFTVELPALPAEHNAGLLAPARREGALEGKRILIVDDNTDAAHTLDVLLKALGHETRVVYDGNQAVAAFDDFQPNLVLLDIGLPGISGYEVARLLRSRGRHGVRIVAVTGWGQEEDRRRAKAAGFDHHLVKPADPLKLVETIAQWRRSQLDATRPPNQALRS